MQWLKALIDELVQNHDANSDFVVSSGVSPSGTYHLGTLREVLTAETVVRELKLRGLNARHIHVVDDLDVFRKVPVDIDATYELHLGKPLCDIPAPDGSNQSYADFYLADLINAAVGLKLEMEVFRANQKYREGFFVPAIEKALTNIDTIRAILENVSGHKLGAEWSPVQIVEDGYLKNRACLAIDTNAKSIKYLDKDSHEQEVSYANGAVKLNWRIDWPARWWLLGVSIEPFGRDHATKGGSYDTGAEIIKQVYSNSPPVPVPYNFINRTGDTKKMSKSKGDTVTAAELLKILPPEIVWFFILRYAPNKLLFFDQGPTLMKLFDDFAELAAKQIKDENEQKLFELCTYGLSELTVSKIPFSHLVASYQAALHDPQKTLQIIRRTEHSQTVAEDEEIIIRELKYIENWLKNWAPDEIRFSLLDEPPLDLSIDEKQFLNSLADKIKLAPKHADGAWYHQAIYDLRDNFNFKPQELFSVVYKVLIGKTSGPRAGWFLSILPQDWLVDRFNLKR